MDAKTRMKLEYINSDLKIIYSAAQVLTLALDSIPTDSATFVGPAELLFKAIDGVKKNLTELIESAEH